MVGGGQDETSDTRICCTSTDAFEFDLSVQK